MVLMAGRCGYVLRIFPKKGGYGVEARAGKKTFFIKKKEEGKYGCA